MRRGSSLWAGVHSLQGGRELTTGGETLSEAFENTGLALYNYMVPLANVGIDSSQSRCARILEAAS